MSVFVTLAVDKAVTLMVVDGVDVIVMVPGVSKQEHTVDTSEFAWAKKLLHFVAAASWSLLEVVAFEDVVELLVAVEQVVPEVDSVETEPAALFFLFCKHEHPP